MYLKVHEDLSIELTHQLELKIDFGGKSKEGEVLMSLVKITEAEFDVVLDIKYATSDNFTGKPIYKKPLCYIHPDGAECLKKAVSLAKELGYRIKIWDTFRPSEAQWIMWEHTPDETFLAHPEKGSPHGRGVAIDLTLLDKNGEELEMGTIFDDFRPIAFHANTEVSKEAQKNRFILLGIMSAAGWDFYKNEWWHYQLFNAKSYPLLSDKELGFGMMVD